MKARIVKAEIVLKIEMTITGGRTALNGSSLQGRIDAPYKEIVKAFGPARASDCGDHKVDAEWVGLANKQPFCIYNYKDGPNYLGAEGTPTEQITDWHIGAHNRATAEIVEAYFAARPGRRTNK